MRRGEEIPDTDSDTSSPYTPNDPAAGMHAGQFPKSHGDGVSDESSDDVAENYAGAGDLKGGSGTEQQASADRAADGDHGHLSGGEFVVETLFLDIGGGGGKRHAAR